MAQADFGVLTRRDGEGPIGERRSLRTAAESCQKLMQALCEAEVGHRRSTQILSVQQRHAPDVAGSDVRETTRTKRLRASALSGDAQLTRLYNQLHRIDRLEYPRSHHQKQFHECFVKASLRSMYGDEFAVREKELLARFGCRRFRTEVMIVTPRRFGKTYSVAQFCAAYATGVLGKEVAIFSTGKRASKKMLDLVMRFLTPLMRSTQKIIAKNVEEIVLFDTETQARNKICSYPSRVQVRHHSRLNARSS